MSSTICETSEHRVSTQPLEFTRNCNGPPATFPLIPRRHSSSPRSHATPVMQTHASARVVVQPPTPPHPPKQPVSSDQVNEVESNAQSTIRPRARRARSYQMISVRPPEYSTPTPEVSKSKGDPSQHTYFRDTKGPLELSSPFNGDNSDDETPRPSVIQRLASKGNVPTHIHIPKGQTGFLTEPSSESPCPPTTVSEGHAPSARRLIRKKSGELVKSSLKSKKRPARGGLSVITGTGTSKSEPSTPTHCKAVHFDSQLEYVKLFLAEQKPLAVSRDGSPTDTSGTESEFPSFIYGTPSVQEIRRKDLVMHVANMPDPASASKDPDVALEEVEFSQDVSCILGRVKVRNLAFEKLVAVRFTFDSWQTTSEVAARYCESLENGKFDRFSFFIRLNGILNRMEEKTLLFALRYTVAGREIWDNNNGQNYCATFKPSVGRPRKSGEETQSAQDATDLRTRLELVAKGRGGESCFSTPVSRRFSGDSARDAPPLLKDAPSLSARYDFGASWQSPAWKPKSSLPQHLRIKTQASNSVPWPSKNSNTLYRDPRSMAPLPKTHAGPLGSPREFDSDVIREVGHIDRDPEDPSLPFPVPTRSRAIRNHQRGSFDSPLFESSAVKITPPGTPVLEPEDDELSSNLQPSHRVHSFPPMTRPGDSDTSVWPHALLRELGGGSGESTPLMTASSSSPSSSFSETFKSARLGGTVDSPLSAGDEYRQLLNRYCFYTGSDTLRVPAEIPRSHSASSVEGLLSSASRSSCGFSGDMENLSTPSRSSSFDDLLYRSGSSTPTARSFVSSESCL